MFKKSISLLAVMLSSYSFAGLESLDNHALANIDGQAGADLSLLLSLNHKQDPTNADNYVLNDLCTATATFERCRLGIAFNNRYNNGEYIGRDGKRYNAAGTEITGTNILGKKLWIVLKGIQGTINLQHMGLDGTDLTYANDTDGKIVVKPAIQLSFDAAKPILIRNFGFNAISMETDTHTDTDTANNKEGYWNKDSGGTGVRKYTNGKYDYSTPVPVNGMTYNTNSFDHGRETGFLGMKMHGNLALQGTIKVFGCDGSHPRC